MNFTDKTILVTGGTGSFNVNNTLIVKVKKLTWTGILYWIWPALMAVPFSRKCIILFQFVYFLIRYFFVFVYFLISFPNFPENGK